MDSKVSKKALFLPGALIALAAMLVLSIGAFSMVRQFDLLAKKREETVVRNGLAQRVEEIAHMVVPQVTWDEAVANLDNRFNATWADANIGKFLHQTDGFDESFVLDSKDRPIFAALDSLPANARTYARWARSAAPLLGKVRAAETQRGRFIRRPGNADMIAKPIQASTIAATDGHLQIITATLVQPDFGKALPRGRRAPIVVSVMTIDNDFLAALSSRFLLDTLHFHLTPASIDPAAARADIVDDQGAFVGALSWAPQRAADILLPRLIAPILLALFVLGGFALALLRRGERMADELIASEARTSHLAYHDALTGLPNRVLLFDRLGIALEQMRRHHQPVAVLCVDLDRFKDVNDNFGHQSGDELIKIAARRFSSQCRASDTLARLGGDEFVIVQTDATAEGAAILANRLIASMAEAADIGVGRVFVGCSIGVTLISQPNQDSIEAVRQADLALYRAKDEGRNQYCFYESEMDVSIKTRRTIETDLRDAIACNGLDIAYQPQVDQRGKIIGVEALLRWTHEQRGIISPAFFVPIAEECGLMPELGYFSLRRVFADSRRWSNLKIAINVSAVQLRLPDFVERLEALIEEFGLDPTRFEIELTEGILLGDDVRTKQTLLRIRDLGFSLALDDFGTGYSSLSYLQKYPIDKIKIDRSFIANLGIDGDAQAVVGAIIKLARALRLNVIAEGVETEDQRQCLIEIGCHDIQGYLFSKPVDADAIDALLIDQAKRPKGRHAA